MARSPKSGTVIFSVTEFWTLKQINIDKTNASVGYRIGFMCNTESFEFVRLLGGKVGRLDNDSMHIFIIYTSKKCAKMKKGQSPKFLNR